jgi:thiamine pyrophosphate-dependent acetolactate synthase large subunit-like protein
MTDKKPTIQVDSDHAQLARFHKIDCPLWGEIGESARAMLSAVTGQHASGDHRPEVAERWRIWRAEKASRLLDTSDKGVSSIAVFDALNRLLPADAIIAVDVGNNTYSFGRYFEASGAQAVLMSGYLGSIGFGYPAALGAWAATQAHRVDKDEFWRQFADRPVVCITGDGGFGQYPWEVNTAVLHGINLTHILLNNKELGKISKEQKAGHWSVWQTALNNPNIADYVTSCGGLGIRVEGAADLAAAIEKALAHTGPSTVEVMTDADLI